MKILRRVQFGNPILRETARQLEKAEVTSPEIRQLIADMKHTLANKKLGVGLAAPQVGRSVAVAIIKIKPTKHRPNVEPFEIALINPVITKTVGQRKGQ